MKHALKQIQYRFAVIYETPSTSSTVQYISFLEKKYRATKNYSLIFSQGPWNTNFSSPRFKFFLEDTILLIRRPFFSFRQQNSASVSLKLVYIYLLTLFEYLFCGRLRLIKQCFNIQIMLREGVPGGGGGIMYTRNRGVFPQSGGWGVHVCVKSEKEGDR